MSLPLNYFDYKTKTLQENSFQTCSVKQNEPLSRFLKEKFDRSIYRFNLRFEGYFSGQKGGEKEKKKKPVSLCRVTGFVGFLCIVLNKVLGSQWHWIKVTSPLPGSDLGRKTLQKHVLFSEKCLIKYFYKVGVEIIEKSLSFINLFGESSFDPSFLLILIFYFA